ncbi:MAG: alpha/beta fold hydrolase [Legionellaceae bacterium]|nr:alpha/beta fold hydrolase [Legionellaceae bacterium]
MLSIDPGKENYLPPQPEDFAAIQQGNVIRGLNISEVAQLQSYAWEEEPFDSAILLIHGFSSSPAVFRQFLPALTGFNGVFAPCLPGHGSSLTDFSRNGAAEWVQVVDTWLEYLCQRFKKVSVLGFSLGGALAYLASFRHPIHHLYLVAPAFTLHIPSRFLLALLPGLRYLGFYAVRSGAGNFYKPSDTEWVYRLLPLATTESILRFLEQDFSKAPPCHTDIFLGRHDGVVNSPHIATICTTWPQQKCHWLEHAAHVLPLEEGWEHIVHRVNQAIL